MANNNREIEMAFTFAEFEGKATEKKSEQMDKFWEGTAKMSHDFPWRGSSATIFLRPDKDEHSDSDFWVEITKLKDGKFLVEFREPAA